MAVAAADQVRGREGDTQSTTPDAAHRLLTEQNDTTGNGANLRASTAADSAALVQSNALPALSIEGHDSPAAKEGGFMHFIHGAEAVVSDLAKGAADEIVHHPLQMLEAAGTGLVVGTALVLAAPEIAAVAAVGGAVYAGYELGTHIDGWMHDANVVSNTQDHTAAELAAAHQDLQHVGGSGALIGAGIIGSFGAAPLAGAMTDMVATAPLLEGPANVPLLEGPANVPLLEGPANVPLLEGPANVPLLEGPANVPLLEGPTATATADATATTAADAPAAAAEQAALTPQEIALQQSIANNQSIFAAAQEQGEVVPSVKQLYQVHFEKVGPGGRVVETLEKPSGVTLQEGDWVATRLNPDGTPNIEEGMVNQWTPKPSEIVKQYLVTPEQLAAETDFNGWTNTSAPPVHMVKVDAPMDFETPWGSMHANAGDWLSNYDFDTTTGRAGSDFARVTARSYQQTYEPVTPKE